MMKTTKQILTLLLVSGLLFSSCKKGVNDPTFSFSSRDARITADWILNSMTQVNKHIQQISDNTYTSTTTYSFDGTTMKETSVNGFGTQEETYPYSFELIINDDGTYNSVENEDGDKYEKTNYWFWANADKNKIAVTFDDFGTFTINRLAKDELVLTQSTVNVHTDSDGNTTTDSSDLTMTFGINK